MTSKKHRMIVYSVAIPLLFIAIVCYAAFPIEAPEEPIRLMYQTNAGKVLFDHQTHTGEKGYGLDCYDCHHHTPDDEAGLISCGACHVPNPEEGVIPEGCLECHEEEEVEDSEYPKRSDAFHQQCMQCHEEFEKGPTSKSEDCGKCHVI